MYRHPHICRIVDSHHIHVPTYRQTDIHIVIIYTYKRTERHSKERCQPFSGSTGLRGGGCSATGTNVQTDRHPLSHMYEHTERRCQPFSGSSGFRGGGCSATGTKVQTDRHPLSHHIHVRTYRETMPTFLWLFRF